MLDLPWKQTHETVRWTWGGLSFLFLTRCFKSSLLSILSKNSRNRLRADFRWEGCKCVMSISASIWSVTASMRLTSAVFLFSKSSNFDSDWNHTLIDYINYMNFFGTRTKRSNYFYKHPYTESELIHKI